MCFGIAMETLERKPRRGSTDLYAERIRNSADCEQVQDKKPLSHDKLNIELWRLAKLRNIHSILRGSERKGVVAFVWRIIESFAIGMKFINIYIDFLGKKMYVLPRLWKKRDQNQAWRRNLEISI